MFTERIGEWWPQGFTASGDSLATVVIEGMEGGRVYECDTRGRELDWGSIVTWDEGRRFVQSWTLGLSRGASTVDLQFNGNGVACEVRLEHRDWSPDQEADRSKFDDDHGWSVVLDAYRRYVEQGD